MRRAPDSKLPDVGTTIFTVMSRLAAEQGAINLSQGFPSFQPPASLLARIARYVEHGDNQYAPMPGVPALCEAIAAKTERLQGRRLDAEREITVTSGATEGLFSTILALVRTGDEVILFDPAYDLYAPAVTLAGGHVRRVPLRLGNNGEFAVDWDRVRAAVTPKTRLVVCNFPHNPTGIVFNDDDLEVFADCLSNSDAWVLADEVYEHLVYDGHTHRSVLRHDALWERACVVSSFGKTFHATGWKIGYCMAPPALTAELRKVHQFSVFTVNTPIQHALADFLREEPGFAASLPAFYAAKRDLFCGLLADSPFRFVPARSTFFQVVDYSALDDESDDEVALRWTRDPGVASIPLSVFCEQPFTGRRLRFCFAKDDDLLRAAAERLSTLWS